MKQTHIQAIFLTLFAGSVQAALIPYNVNGVDLVYDDDYTPRGRSSPGLTWTANAQLAATETFGVAGIYNGKMTPSQAKGWIDGMNEANYGGANDWRLWSALNSDGSGPCFSYECTGSEFGHLFYIEGAVDQGAPITSSSILTNLFSNLQDGVYWSETEVPPSGSYSGWWWWFDASVGSQSTANYVLQRNVWAVRDGRISAAPLPSTAALIAFGLLCLLGFVSSKRNHGRSEGAPFQGREHY